MTHLLKTLPICAMFMLTAAQKAEPALGDLLASAPWPVTAVTTEVA